MGVVVLACAGVSSNPTEAQVGGRLPPFSYYSGFNQFYRADYRSALRSFTSSATTAYKFGDQRFLDSVCAWTMMGECHYHLGNYTEALVLYERSLDLYLRYTELQWQDRLELPDPRSIQRDDVKIQRARVTWFRPQRKVQVARLPDEMSMLFGRFDALRAFQEGGVYNPAELRQVDVTEIMRCTALAMHRRRVIRGRTCKYDAFTTRLVNGLVGTKTSTNTVVGAYNGVLRGIAAASQEDWSKAAKRLKAASQFAGGYDHPLGPVAYLTAADIALETGSDRVASTLALEASYLAAVYDQFDLIEESLSLATMVHLKNDRSVFTPLENAIVWANRSANRLQASLQVRLAECLVESGNANGAARVLKSAQKAVRRESVSQTVIGSRYQYVSAAANFLAGDSVAGQKLLSSALNQAGNGSLSRFRMQLANTLSAKGAIGQRQSDQLFGVLLSDPTEDEWKLDPFEAMSSLVFSRVNALERWFEIVVSRKDYTRAVDVSERLRRYRFYENLPLSGRLLAFRWMLDGPSQALSKNALARRAKFFVRHPDYQDLVRQAEQVNLELDALPAVTDPKSDDQKKQRKLLPRASAIAAQQETYLAKIALLREPVELEFPPQRQAEKWLEQIQPGQRAMVVVAAAGAYHFMMVSDQGVQYLTRVTSRKLKPLVNAAMRSLQVADSSLDAEDLSDRRWQKPVRKLMQTIWPGVKLADWAGEKELLIVPDGWLWYVPVGLFPAGDQEIDPPLLADQVAIRFSPTLYAGFGAQRPESTAAGGARSVVLAGKMSGAGQIERVEAQVAELQKQQPLIKRVKQLPATSGLFSSLTDRWLVWGGLNVDRDRPLSFVPIPAGVAQQDQPSLNSWIVYPWRGPESVIAPGFQSDAGKGLKGQQEGSDLFLTTCGLMAAGAKEIVVSRWNSGGDINLLVGREYLKQRKSLPAAEALVAAKNFARASEVSEESEPKLRLSRGTDKLAAKHPVFWSSLIVVEAPAEVAAGKQGSPNAGSPNAGN